MFPLRIHCWGGLGSQLLAVALLVDLEERFPMRKLSIVLHQGGVTLRESEIDLLFSGIKTKHILDFNKNTHIVADQRSYSPKKSLKHFIKQSFMKIGFVLPLSNDRDYLAIRSFTISIRGHYSYRKISNLTVQALLKKLNAGALQEFRKYPDSFEGLGVHYRLGDLLSLETKEPLDESRVVAAAKGILEMQGFASVSVYSDSPEIAKNKFTASLGDVEIIGRNVSTWETISDLSKIEYFMGTFSKVSLWIVIFRYYSVEQKISYMPQESRKNIEDLLGANLDSARISFY